MRKNITENNTLKTTEYTPAVVGFAIDETDKKVLLGLRKKVSNNLGKDLYAGIGGKIGDQKNFASETPNEALIREFQEEIGITPTEFKEIGLAAFTWLGKPKWNLITRVYKITKWSGKPTETDVIRPKWFNFDKIPYDNMWKDNKHWIPFVLNETPFKLRFIYDENGEIAEVVDFESIY